MGYEICGLVMRIKKRRGAYPALEEGGRVIHASVAIQSFKLRLKPYVTKLGL